MSLLYNMGYLIYMFIANYVLLRIRLFIFSPIFFSILTMVVCIICWSLDSVMLCDGETLEDLKNALSIDIEQYNKIMQDYKYYDDLRWEWVNKPERVSQRILYYNSKASSNIEDATNILAKIRRIESNIQKIESSFVSNIPKQWFEVKVINKEFFKWIP